MRVLSTLAIRAGLLVVTLPKCAKWLIGDSFLFRSEMCECRSLVGEGGRSECNEDRPGEGCVTYPSPGSLLAGARNSPPSPTRGEGKKNMRLRFRSFGLQQRSRSCACERARVGRTCLLQAKNSQG